MNFNDPFSHGSYLLWDGGSIKFDIISNETVERDAAITEHPVETGANIADHYRIKLRGIKLEAFVSQEPLDPTLYPGMSGEVQGVEIALPPYPAAALAIAQGFDAATFALGAIQRGFIQAPPTAFMQQALVYANPIDTVAYVLGVLDGLYQNATLIDVATPSYYYAQHLLGPVTTKRDEKTGAGCIISLELRQVLFVSTQSVAAPALPVQKKDAPSVDKGKQNPTVPKQSFALSGLQVLGFLK